MYIYKFVVEAVRERFMESPLHDTSEYYIIAHTYDQAHTHVFRMMEQGGWKVNKVTGKKIYLHDIRDARKQIYKPTIKEYLFVIGNSLAPINIYDEGESRTKDNLLYWGTVEDAMKSKWADYCIVDVDVHNFGGNVGLEIYIIKSRGPHV